MVEVILKGDESVITGLDFSVDYDLNMLIVNTNYQNTIAFIPMENVKVMYVHSTKEIQ